MEVCKSSSIPVVEAKFGISHYNNTKKVSIEASELWGFGAPSCKSLLSRLGGEMVGEFLKVASRGPESSVA